MNFHFSREEIASIPRGHWNNELFWKESPNLEVFTFSFFIHSTHIYFWFLLLPLPWNCFSLRSTITFLLRMFVLMLLFFFVNWHCWPFSPFKKCSFYGFYNNISYVLQIHTGFFKIVLIFVNEQREINIFYQNHILITTNMFLFSVIFSLRKSFPFVKSYLHMI